MLEAGNCAEVCELSFSDSSLIPVDSGGMPFKASYVVCLTADKILQLQFNCFASSICSPQPWLQSAQAYAAKVEFPKDEEALGCTVLVGSMNPQVTIEQVSLCLRTCGTVVAPCKVNG